MKLTKTRLALILVVAAVAAPTWAFLDYVLPHHAVVRVTGADVRRYDQDGRGHDNRPSTSSRDVYQIFSEDPVTKKVHVFHNEDTGWAFPWYLKFNAGDIQGDAISIAGERETALLTYYGWRINLFSMFPNVVAIKRVPADYSPFPWFNLLFLGSLAILLAWLGWTARRISRRRASRSAAQGAPQP